MRTLRNWRHRYLAKTLISGGIIGLALFGLDQLSRYHEAQRLWSEREWLFERLKAIALPPWAQFALLVTCLFLFLWAIYELQTRPPIILETERRYPVGLRSLDLALGHIDLDETPEELSQRFQASSGMETEKLKGEYYHKYLWASGVFDTLERLQSGHYSIHMRCGDILMFVTMNTIDEHGHLEKLSRGDSVSVRGRITYVNSAAGVGTITLEEGQFAESQRLVSGGYSEKPNSF